MASIPITPCFLKFRAFSSSSSSQYSYNQNTQIGLMLASNSVRSLPRPSLLSSSIPNFRVSKFAPKSISLLPQTFRFCETHQRLTRKFIASYLLSLVGPNTAFYKVILGGTKRQFASFFRSSNLRFFFEKALCGEIQKWKISCFRNEELCSGESNPEVIEEVLQEEQRKSEIDKSSVGKRDWVSLLAEAPNIVRRVIGEPWDVPWTAKTIFQVMLLWIVSFWFIGSWMIPFGAHLVGFSKESLTFRGQALFSLLTDVTEGLAGILILQRCLSRFRPLPRDWFKFSVRGNWIFDLVLGCFMFPLVNRLSQFNLDLLPVLPSTPVTLSSVEQSIMARDPVAMALYALVLVVCAPMWEEIVFRGFLLPSLTKYMPVWCSILVSSVAFALAHFNVQRMLPLIFLGVVMGIIYARSRNLLPSILLHSLWNGFVFIDLMK